MINFKLCYLKTEGIRLKPDFVSAYSSRGLTKNLLGDKYGAIADFTEVIRLTPSAYKNIHAIAYVNRG